MVSQNRVVKDQKITLPQRKKPPQMRVQVKMRVIQYQRTKTIRVPIVMAKASLLVKNMIKKVIKKVKPLGSKMA